MDKIHNINGVAVLTSAQSRELDRMAEDIFGISGIVLMENAGRCVAYSAMDMLGERKNVVIVCGKGNNGGDGFVCARHLINVGKNVKVLLVGDPEDVKGTARSNLEILFRMKARILVYGEDITGFDKEFIGADIIIDALLGSGTKGELKEPYKSIIETINRSGCSVLSVDIPSGLHPDTGIPLPVAVNAAFTVSFVLPKAGLLAGRGPSKAGKIIVGDIGISSSILQSYLI